VEPVTPFHGSPVNSYNRRSVNNGHFAASVRRPKEGRFGRYLHVWNRRTTSSDPRFEVILCWSAEDAAFIAGDPELPGCAADGRMY